MRSLIVIGIAVVLLIGCKGENAEVDMGYTYYPARVGSWIEYEVDSIRHFPDDDADTLRYQIREYLESAFTDEAGRSARRIERYFRLDADADWGLADIWMVSLTERKVEKVEENIRYTRLTFPVRQGQFWDGNALNENDPWNYSYEAVDVPLSSNGVLFDSTATVIQEGAVNLIEQERGSEIYVRNIGMIYKEHIEIQTDVNYTTDPSAANIQGGYELYYKYLDHGQN